MYTFCIDFEKKKNPHFHKQKGKLKNVSLLDDGAPSLSRRWRCLQLKPQLPWHWESASPSPPSCLPLFLIELYFRSIPPDKDWHSTVSSQFIPREFILRWYARKILSHLICLRLMFKKQSTTFSNPHLNISDQEKVSVHPKIHTPSYICLRIFC